MQLGWGARRACGGRRLTSRPACVVPIVFGRYTDRFLKGNIEPAGGVEATASRDGFDLFLRRHEQALGHGEPELREAFEDAHSAGVPEDSSSVTGTKPRRGGDLANSKWLGIVL